MRHGRTTNERAVCVHSSGESCGNSFFDLTALSELQAQQSECASNLPQISPKWEMRAEPTSCNRLSMELKNSSRGLIRWLFFGSVSQCVLSGSAES